MTDHELIAAIANRLGWSDVKVVSLGMAGEHLEGIPPDNFSAAGTRLKIFKALPPWLTSVDAALAVLGDLDYRINKAALVHVELFDGGEPMGDAVDESLPLAILQAFLEPLKEKP